MSAPRPEERQPARRRTRGRWRRERPVEGLVHISVPLRKVLEELGLDPDAILADAEEDAGVA